MFFMLKANCGKTNRVYTLFVARGRRVTIIEVRAGDGPGLVTTSRHHASPPVTDREALGAIADNQRYCPRQGRRHQGREELPPMGGPRHAGLGWGPQAGLDGAKKFLHDKRFDHVLDNPVLVGKTFRSGIGVAGDHHDLGA